MTSSAATQQDGPLAPRLGPGGPGGRRPFRRSGRFLNSRAVGWIVIVLLVVLWQVARSNDWYTSPIVPGPSQIFSAWKAAANDGSLWPAVLSTLKVTFLGFALGAVGGVALGLLMARLRFAYVILEPVVELLRPIPIVAVIPVMILFLGIGDELKVAAVAAAAVIPILLNTIAGVASVVPTMRETATGFGLGRWAATWEVYLPWALPSIFVGLRTALSLSIVIAVLTQMIAGNTGIGYLIITAQQSLNVDLLWALVVTLAVIGYLANILFMLLQRVSLPWAPEVRSKRH